MSKEATQSVQLGSIELPYVRYGAKGRPLLVLLHGGGGPLATQGFAHTLAQSYEIIAPTHPGFDGTPIPEFFNNIEDLVFLYLDFLDALDLSAVNLVGFSMGGWLAMELAVRSTERLQRLILVDSVGIKPGQREDRDIADVFGLPHSELNQRLFHNVSNAPDQSALSDSARAVIAANRTALALYTWEPYMHNPQLPHRLHRVRIPSHLIWGQSDGIVSVDYAQALQAMLPNATLDIIENAGHLPQIEQPDAFVSTVQGIVTA
jgi:pimeloyl-ACP methyl ester carboxylesterase